MKLEEGMYVRTKDGIIGKYNVVKEWTDVPTLNGYYEIKEIEREYIDNELYRNYVVIKASHSIIDLIELGDVITTNNLCGEVTHIEGDKIYTTCYDGEYCYDYQIKSIVTKEMFSSVEYRMETD